MGLTSKQRYLINTRNKVVGELVEKSPVIAIEGFTRLTTEDNLPIFMEDGRDFYLSGYDIDHSYQGLEYKSRWFRCVNCGFVVDKNKSIYHNTRTSIIKFTTEDGITITTEDDYDIELCDLIETVVIRGCSFCGMQLRN